MPDRRNPSWPRRLCGVPLLVLVCCGPLVAQTVQDPRLEVQTLTSGLSFPTSMTFVGPDDILVLQKNDGRVRRVIAGQLQPAAVLDVAVNASSERGLLGIARDPDFVNNGHVYLFYTESSTGVDGGSPAGNRVYRYTWNGSSLVAPRLVLDLPVTPGPNHDGGVLLFGPDDRLYVVIGDLNRNGKLENFPAGDDADDTGVILRVDVHGRGLPDNPLVVPGEPDNPLNRYYGYGVRNSFGMAFDPLSGMLWDTENGPSTMDEVNRVVPGFNSGWERIMGPEARSSGSQDDLWVAAGSTYVDPAFSWFDTVAPTALTFAASRVLGCELEHDLLVGDDNCGQLYRFRLTAARDEFSFVSAGLQDRVADNLGAPCSNELEEVVFGSGLGLITDLENGPDGRLYVVSLIRGEILRIGPRADAPGDADGDAVADSCDCDAADTGAFAVPREVPLVRLSPGAPLRLGWDPQAATAGNGTTYQVISGTLSELRAGGDFSAACELASGLTTPATTDGRSAPSPGEGFYYLARARNGCAAGTFGDGSADPDPRDELDAATPPPCL